MREPQHGRHQSVWTPEHDALLRQFWKEGHSCSRTAEKLIEAGCPPRTRNAIIGRVHRLGLPKRGFSNASNRTYQSRRKHIGSEQTSAQRRARGKAARVKWLEKCGVTIGEGKLAGVYADRERRAFERAINAASPLPPLNTPLASLEWGMCRAVSDTSTWGKPLYCGHACGETESYCAAHKARFFVPLKPRVRHASEQSRADRARYRDSARWAGI